MVQAVPANRSSAFGKHRPRLANARLEGGEVVEEVRRRYVTPHHFAAGLPHRALAHEVVVEPERLDRAAVVVAPVDVVSRDVRVPEDGLADGEQVADLDGGPD